MAIVKIASRSHSYLGIEPAATLAPHAASRGKQTGFDTLAMACGLKRSPPISFWSGRGKGKALNRLNVA